MLYRKQGEWAIVPYKVRFTEYGQEKEKYTEDKQWWKDLADKHDHIEIIGFMNVVPTTEQEARLEEVKNIGEGFGAECSTYVVTGELPGSGSLELQNLKLKKDNEELAQIVADLTAEVLMGGA